MALQTVKKINTLSSLSSAGYRVKIQYGWLEQKATQAVHDWLDGCITRCGTINSSQSVRCHFWDCEVLQATSKSDSC